MKELALPKGIFLKQITMAPLQQSKTALDLFHELHDRVLQWDADGQAELFAPQGVWELPFAPDPVPRRIEGREAIRRFGKMGMERSRAKGRQILRYAHLRIYPMSDPDTLVVEFDLEGVHTPTGTPYSMPFIQVLQVAGGQIVRLRDYFRMELMQ